MNPKLPTTKPAHGNSMLAAMLPVKELTTGEFAALTKLSRAYVSLLCDMGRIPFRRKTDRPTSHRLIKETEVERFRNVTE